MVMVQLGAAPVHAPDQLLNSEPEVGVAVSVTTSPTLYAELQVPPQLIRRSDEPIVPLPIRATVIDGATTLAAVICALISAPTSPGAGPEQLDRPHTA